MDKPVLIRGDQFSDERGTLRFVNSFDFKDVKRFYIIEQQENVVRAWQGHKIETKYFFPISGSFLICCVKVDDWKNPSKNLPVNEFTLSERENRILKIPGGYANGIMAMEENGILLGFSSFSLEDSKKDDYRFNRNMWKNWEEGNLSTFEMRKTK